MAEMNDYSGDYRNDFDLSDLSKDALITLLSAYKKIFGDWFTYTEKIVREGLGDKATDEEVHAIFIDAGSETVTQLAIPELKEALNVQEDDEAIEYKYYQICCDVEGLKKGYYGNSAKIQNFLTNHPKEFDLSGISHEQFVNVVKSFRRIYQGYRDMAGPNEQPKKSKSSPTERSSVISLANGLVTCCPFCEIVFDSAIGQKGAQHSFEVIDIVKLVNQSTESKVTKGLV